MTRRLDQPPKRPANEERPSVTLRLGDCPDGETVFLRERFGDEVRETYYQRRGERMFLLGLTQGSPKPLRDEAGRVLPPRYQRRAATPHEYALIPGLPVHPMSESVFARRAEPQSGGGAGAQPRTLEELEADLWRRTMERHDITREQIRALLSALRDAGVALVPREPTQEMLIDAFQAWLSNEPEDGDAYSDADTKSTYRAMLAASPYEENPS